MAYQALYRKYRSQRFDEMVGQEVVATTLKNAIVNHQISHAYLFSGPRGTGKTSAAKIFAKAINCPNQVDGEPCNNCFICDSITKGSLDDVIELDAASNNGVDEIREIRDKSTYAASQATYKVYIIDEVHMLSTGAFNALLKTLEEPTENVVFVLATTELQKIPATIISRVQRFAFKSITTGDIRTYLAKIMADEGLEFDGKALDVIAKAAEGGMRDALSLLDQALSFSSGKLEENDALLVTGSIAADALVTYVAALFEHDEAKALTELDKIFAEGKNMLRFTEDLLAYLRDLLLDKNSQYDRGQIFSWIDIAIESLKTIKETTQTKIAADVMTMRLAEIGQNNLLTASQGEIPNQLTAEIATLKTEINQLKAQISAGQIQVNSDSQNNLLTEKVKASPKPIASKKRQINKDLIYKALAEATNEARKAALSAWPELVASVTKPADRALLNNTAPVAASENFLVVTFPHENLAKRVSENEELQLFCGNLLSSIAGFAPEIISLAEQDWQEVRAEYVSNLKSENVQEDEEDEKEPDETVNLAKELFGEKVVEIND
ncbi:DNA polymerase III subunit gamma/tau [Lactococcus lactis]|jgi:DNA polymerase-3 subunit gamma/tau|uniref:DNA polymerase III subunit gamma/tau n=1 Tax=Lactococcus TaxID=1357 RepID=UPI001DB25CC3|nr:DNA polymerase III subunit gamma/tau [Lactococcus lactis]MBS7068107.1 DNA polymerase III subunit gamma/tau [Lactococcus lactis]MDT2871412.1 DNA polymerase III subunit gamma/tau [Lactococcus lactis]MDT2874027.1 DNA polymerase III subunit gamma/tau [Lactococcus lactis]MDT2876745.1 DNA polymerase III subunit gamma/tau [Lactococcus lactis]MDT2890512.1 DNA polymerase III subunit gamma/tau [Lactococcus lactis]